MFEKYPKIESSEKNKTIMRLKKQYPELFDDVTWVSQEKIDGSNIQLEFDVNSHQLIPYKRSGYAGNDFFNIGEVLHRLHDDIVSIFVEISNDKHCNLDDIVLCGELFGEGVQKRINYGNEKRIAFYDVKVNGEFQTPTYLYNTIDSDFKHMIIPVESTGDFHTLNVMNVENFVSNFSPSNDIAEGIVLKPSIPYYDKGSGSMIAFKKKRESFSDNGGKAQKKAKDDISDKAIELNIICQRYINENRLQDLFSKYGEIQHEKQIGEYLKLYNQDFLEDFENDYSEELSELTEHEKKFVKNMNAEIADMLKAHL